MKKYKNFQEEVDEINKSSVHYSSKSLTMRPTPEGETPDPEDND